MNYIKTYRNAVDKVVRESRNWQSLKERVERGEVAVVPTMLTKQMADIQRPYLDQYQDMSGYKAAIQAAPDIIKEIEGE